MRVLVTGGTGVVGRSTVVALARRGHQVRALSRRGREVSGATAVAGDLTTGEGLGAAVDGAEVIVDCSNAGTTREAEAARFFESAAAHLEEAGRAAGVRHLVALSIVGIDRVDLGYYVAKRRHEAAVLDASIPATILRATQFHEFPGQILARMRLGPVAFVPRMRVQPIAAAEVARALADIAEGAPRERAPDLGGPREEELVELARRLSRSRRSRVAVAPVRIPGRVGRALRSGSLLLEPGGDARGPTFDAWLSASDE